MDFVSTLRTNRHLNTTPRRTLKFQASRRDNHNDSFSPSSARNIMHKNLNTYLVSSDSKADMEETESTASDHSSLDCGQISRHHSSISERAGNFKVVIRVRPPLPRELHSDRPFQNVIQVDSSGHVLTVAEQANTTADQSNSAVIYGNQVFSFDHVYDQHCTQHYVYENTAKAVVESSLEGYNATIFAYGQTGTGKTYTMEGFNAAGSVEERGIIPRAIEQIFQHIQAKASARMRFLVRASYLQIYNETISDLLKPERSNLTIREDKKRGVFVEGLSEWVVRSPEEIYGLMERGGAMRATGSTRMNEISSRSHAVFIIIAEQSKTSYVDTQGNDISQEEFTALVNALPPRFGTSAGSKTSFQKNRGIESHGKLESMIRQSFKVGKLNLVDLAGSERVRLSGATGQRLEESKKINQSLSALGNVIAALTDARGRQHIPYRDSKLTRILEDSLGGNCKTTMMAMISPALEAMVESVSTLKFANRAKNIKNEARVNEDLDQKSLLRKYERELKRLRAELDEKSRNVVDKRRLLELEEQRRRAEEDKMAAIRALEERSQEFMKEKEEKKKLEQRIAKLMSQMLTNAHQKHQTLGATLTSSTSREDDPVRHRELLENDCTVEHSILREAIQEHQERIRKEYDVRVAELERERNSIEEEKAQVDRYKQLLLKQRDIMIALTQRLNERDEQLTALQDEVDAYDQHQKDLEEKLDAKTAQLIHLERVVMEEKTRKRNMGRNEGTDNLMHVCEPEEPMQRLAGSQALEKEELRLSNTENSNFQKYAQSMDVMKAKVQQLETANEEIVNRVRSQLGEKEAAMRMLQQHCDTYVKERRAIQTIMEHKIKALTKTIGEASIAAFEKCEGMMQASDSAKWLFREIHALQRLVNACIVALRNADSGQMTKSMSQSGKDLDGLKGSVRKVSLESGEPDNDSFEHNRARERKHNLHNPIHNE